MLANVDFVIVDYLDLKIKLLKLEKYNLKNIMA